MPPGSRPYFRIQRSLALARTKDYTKAVAGVEDISRTSTGPPLLRLELARVFALSAAAASEDRPKADAYAARAVEELKRVVSSGYRDAARLKMDADFAVLRTRADFRELLQDLDAKK